MSGSPVLLAAILFLAYTNGANDNFKGVATLFGSRTASYRTALAWATATTCAGSLAALLMSQGLVKVFSGTGLVPEAFTGQPHFLLAVGLGAAWTVFCATLTGFPVSTTHALTGALVGAGWMAVGPRINLSVLGYTFFLPLAVSPVLSLGIARRVHPLLSAVRRRIGVTKEWCLCTGLKEESVVIRPGGAAVLKSTGFLLTVGELSQCVERYQGILFGVRCQRLLDALHYLSAGAVGFARGLNDTPKIVALFLTARLFSGDPRMGFLIVAAAMMLGGVLSAKEVARTMSRRITGMNHGEGFSANLVTGLLVALASRYGLPVSTTHVSCGALFGIGLANRKADLAVVRNILFSWVITLPAAALLAALVYFMT